MRSREQRTSVGFNFSFILKPWTKSLILIAQTTRIESDMSYNNKLGRKDLEDRIEEYSNRLYLLEKVSRWTGWMLLIGGLLWTVYSTLSGISASPYGQDSSVLLTSIGSALSVIFLWFIYDMIRVISFGMLWTFIAIEDNTRQFRQ